MHNQMHLLVPETARRLAGKYDLLLAISVYFADLRAAAASAAEPASHAASNNVQVRQQTTDGHVPGQWFSACQMTRERPSGCIWPAKIMRLFGDWNASRDDNLSNPVIQGVVPDRSTWSFLADKAMQCTSSKVLQWNLCDTQRGRPSCRPTPTLTALTSSLRPQDEIGMAYSQSPLCGNEAAKKRG